MLRELAVIVPGELTLDVVPHSPKDNHIVACAVEGEASYIISGDHHLKDLDQYQAVRILSPVQFRAVLEDAQAK